MKKLYGTGVALVTPFNENLEVDFPALKKLLRHTSKGVDYYVVMGTTGEASTVTADEKKNILAFVKENSLTKLPLVYGIGGNDTKQVLDTIAGTDFAGVDAVLSVSPYYSKPSQEGIYQHFKVIAEACPVPVLLYNVPGRTASNITAETALRLAGHPNIVGIKEASGNLEQCMRIAHAKPKDFLLISGDDLLTVPLYALGAKGVISVLANAFPVIFRKMKEFSFAGKYERASREAFKLLELNPLMYEEGNPVGLKALLKEMRLCTEKVRLPLASASEGLHRKISSLGRVKNKG
jgi:4-hydroxy-tetrahydrodipicolinate synthase